MEVYDAISKRRSVRSFDGTPVAREQLDVLLKQRHDELPKLVAENFPVDARRQSVMGHSMGAFVAALTAASAASIDSMTPGAGKTSDAPLNSKPFTTGSQRLCTKYSWKASSP